MAETVATFDPDSDANNYIHAFLKAAAAEKGPHTFNDAQLLATANDLFSAGTETTSTTLRWAILYLAHYPEFQEKLYQQIKHEVGTNSLPNYADRAKLPFADALIMETQRMGDLVPLGLMRRPLGPAKVLGYDIPENAVVLPLLTNVLHNPDVFPEPFKFNPNRFLDSTGKVVRDPQLIPFQAGNS